MTDRMVNSSGKRRNNVEAGGGNELSYTDGSLENRQMTASEQEGQSGLAALSILRETEIMIAMKTAGGRGTGEAT